MTNSTIRYALILLALVPLTVLPCTSVIVSGNATADGRPLMLKHRDTDDQQNSVRLFCGERYAFIGLVNSTSPDTEVWTGTNEVGFSIMNTASYNFREDSLPDVQMDREGELMYRALSICVTVSDFERLLDTCAKPMGVEANFGVIDAHGGAAYYEVNNFRWIKYDVNRIPCGYRVVTNFCEAGRREDYQGWDRYCIASEVMSAEWTPEVDHRFFFERLSRNTTERNGNCIPRKITSASIVIEGVRAGSDPLQTVMWTILGNPLTHIAEPLALTDYLKYCGKRQVGKNAPAKVDKLRTVARIRNTGLDRKKEERLRKAFLRRHYGEVVFP